MGKRKVEVELILDAHNYLDETARAAAATKALEAETEHLGTASDHAGTDLGELAKNTDRASTSTAGLSRNMRDTGEALRLLDARIAQTKLSVRDLGVEFATTGDAAAGQQLGSERSLLGKLVSLRKEVAASYEDLKKLAKLDAPFQLGDMGGGKSGLSKWITDLKNGAVEAATAGLRIGSSIAGGIGAGMGELGAVLMPIVIASLVGAAVIATPMLVSIIGGAIAGGVGTLGVAAGIFAASHDPMVQSGLSALGERVKKEFFAAGETFVGPVLKSFEVLGHALDDIQFGEVLKKAAPYVETIVTGLADMLRNIMPGLNKMMDRLGPFARVAAQGFSELGGALGTFLDDMSRSPGAAEGLKAAFMAIEGVVRLLSKGIFYLAEAYDWMLQKAYAAAIALATLADSIPGMSGLGDAARHVGFVVNEMRNVPGAADGASNSFDRFADGATKSAAKLDPFVQYLWEAQHRVDGLHGAMSSLFADQMGMDQATLRWQEDLIKLTEETKKHGHSLDTNTQIGLDHRRMILGMIQDADGIRQATTKQTGSIEEGNRAYERELILLEEKLRQLHYTEDQIKDMVGEYHINVDINLNYRTSGSFPQQAKNLALEDRLLGLRKRAYGGPVGPGAYVVGDGGRPEVLQMGAGQYGHVYPSVQSWQSAQSPAGGWQSSGGGGATQQVDLAVIVKDTSGRVLRQELITDALNRNQSSSVVAAAYP